MEKELERLEIAKFEKGIEIAQTQPDKYSEYFTYSLSRNKRNLKNIIESIQEVQNVTLKEYNKEYKELNEKLCDRDESKKPISENNQYSFVEKAMEYTKAKEELDAKHKEALDKIKAFMKEKEKVDIYIHKHAFPTLHGDIADLLFIMREEPKEEK